MKKKVYFNSPVILWFVIICTVALGLDYLTGSLSTKLVFMVYRSSFRDPLTYVRLIGHIFGHGSLEHYANNMIYILLAGPIVEEKYGSENLLWSMGITAVVTGLVHVIVSPQTALLGASGIVFMLIMMSAVVGDRDGIPLTLVLMIVVYLGQQVFYMVTMHDTVSYLTHIIGGVIGVAAGWSLRPRRRHYR